MSESDDGLLNNSPNWNKTSLTDSNDEQTSDLLLISKKFEDLGFCFECDPTQRTFSVKQPQTGGLHLVYHWYDNTLEHDLSSFFEDVYLSLKRKKFA